MSARDKDIAGISGASGRDDREGCRRGKATRATQKHVSLTRHAPLRLRKTRENEQPNINEAQYTKSLINEDVRHVRHVRLCQT